MTRDVDAGDENAAKVVLTNLSESGSSPRHGWLRIIRRKSVRCGRSDNN